jgi:hypothetical protein
MTRCSSVSIWSLKLGSPGSRSLRRNSKPPATFAVEARFTTVGGRGRGVTDWLNPCPQWAGRAVVAGHRHSAICLPESGCNCPPLYPQGAGEGIGPAPPRLRSAPGALISSSCELRSLPGCTTLTISVPVRLSALMVPRLRRDRPSFLSMISLQVPTSKLTLMILVGPQPVSYPGFNDFFLLSVSSCSAEV